jgi:hypothetical protein
MVSKKLFIIQTWWLMMVLFFSLEKTKILESELEACKSMCHYRQYEEKFLFSLLQRQTAMILQAANLPVSASPELYKHSIELKFLERV